jgi:hypothetical protein
MSLDNRRDWREICEDLLKEKNPGRVNALLTELLAALEARARERGPQPPTPQKS